MKKIIELDNLTKSFDGQVILKGIHLDIYENEFVTLLGPSGCGKTTTLRIMAGFEEPESGTVLFDGMNMEGVPPYKRELNTVFQKYALFPHMDVYDNVAFAQRIVLTPTRQIKRNVPAILAIVGLAGKYKAKPKQLSGGEQQRVAMARALINKPPILLCDEPTGNLDEEITQDIVNIFKDIAHQQNKTVIIVTHETAVAEETDVVFELKKKQFIQL